METLKEKFEALTHRIQSSGKPAAHGSLNLHLSLC